MKNLILHNWAVKITSLVLAITLWYLIKKNVETTPLPSNQMPVVQFLPAPQASGETPDSIAPATAPVKSATPEKKKDHAKQQNNH